MDTIQLQAKGGDKWSFRLDALTVSKLHELIEHLEKSAGVKPSHAVVVRRAIQMYACHVQELNTARKREEEKRNLLLAAGRPDWLN